MSAFLYFTPHMGSLAKSCVSGFLKTLVVVWGFTSAESEFSSWGSGLGGGGVWGGLPELPCASPPGIDLMDMASDILQPQGDDVARISWQLRGLIRRYQETFSVIEKVLCRAGRLPPPTPSTSSRLSLSPPPPTPGSLAVP